MISLERDQEGRPHAPQYRFVIECSASNCDDLNALPPQQFVAGTLERAALLPSFFPTGEKLARQLRSGPFPTSRTSAR